MGKISETKGLSRIVVLAIVFAALLVIVIGVKLVNDESEKAMQEIDEQLVITAEHEARLFHMGNDLLEEAVYDAQNKTFVDVQKAKKTVKPYGSAKENKGRYILIVFGEDEKIVSKWVTP